MVVKHCRVLLFSLLSGLCAYSLAIPRPDSTITYEDREAYRVYAVILRENRGYNQAESVFIRKRTLSSSQFAAQDCLENDPGYGALVLPALAEYKRVNRSRQDLSRLFTLDKPYKLVPETEFAGPFWRPDSALDRSSRDHSNFPGIFELSSVGFNRKRTIAVVSMNYNCGGLCSGGGMRVLRKEREQWKQIPELGCTWKS